jgi:hypothetical protein
MSDTFKRHFNPKGTSLASIAYVKSICKCPSLLLDPEATLTEVQSVAQDAAQEGGVDEAVITGPAVPQPQPSGRGGGKEASTSAVDKPPTDSKFDAMSEAELLQRLNRTVAEDSCKVVRTFASSNCKGFVCATCLG